MSKANTTIRNNKLLCLNCGGQYVLQMPIRVDDMTTATRIFNTQHKNCKPGGFEEPKPNMDEGTLSRANWWMANGHIGMSSKTMWSHFMGVKGFPVNHPYDPDDFSRCYKLLQTVPEWKDRVSELAILSEEWEGLAENWNKLTEMYEENERTEWKNAKKIGMFDFMQTLIR